MNFFKPQMNADERRCGPEGGAVVIVKGVLRIPRGGK
jgi:hypothetical protein